MNTPLASVARDHESEEIPVIDVAAMLAGRPGALENCAAALRHAYEDVGFWFCTGHGVGQDVVDAVFAAAARFHALPLEEKMRLRIDHHNIGYLPMKGSTTRHSQINPNNKPNLNEAFFIKRDLPADHPDVLAARRFRGMNRWPADLPGFRETCIAYCEAMEKLALSLLPMYACALGLPAGFFAPAFVEPQYTLRVSHYPQQEVVRENEFGLAPHTDTSFMTMLAQNEVPGLAVQTASGRWIDAPVIPGAFLVNSGDLLRRWSNDRFRATPHRVINRSGQERYAIPFFFDTSIDYPMTCLPTCSGPGNPPRYPTTTYYDYMIWFQNQNYNHIRDKDGARMQGA